MPGGGRRWRAMRAKYAVATQAPEADGQFESRWATVRGLRLHYRATKEDPPGETPVVLVHGLAVSHRYLMPLAAQLASRYPVRAVDLPGFGLSEGPRAVLDVPALADRLAEWMRAAESAPAVLIANSFGTQIAVDLAYRHPDLVRSLVLVGPTMDPRARSMGRQALRWLRGAPHEDPLQLPILLRDLADAGLFRAVRTLRMALRDPVEDKLPGVRVPTLVTRGELEAVTPQAWAEEVARLLPCGELAIVPSSPHDAVYTAAAQLADIAVPFLERTAAGRTGV